MAEAILLAIIAIGGIGFIRVYALLRVHTAEIQNIYTQRFFDHANALIENENASDAIVSEVKSLALMLDDGYAASVFFDQIRIPKAHEAAPLAPPTELPLGLEHEWASMFYCWLISMSCRRPIFGMAYRSKLLALMAREKEPQSRQFLRWAEQRLNLRHA